MSVSALVCTVVSLFLPLHYHGSDDPFGGYFESLLNTRQFVGSLIGGFWLPFAIVIGIWVMHRRSAAVAAGLFLGLAMFSAVSGVLAPLFVFEGTQPFVLGAVRLLVGALLFGAAWQSGGPVQKPELPPPPVLGRIE